VADIVAVAIRSAGGIPRYASERGIRPRSIESIRHRLTQFEKMLGRSATLADLNDTVMNHWTTKLFDAGLSAVTVKGYRGMPWHFGVPLTR
jgi:site-specific recombinase XerD